MSNGLAWLILFIAGLCEVGWAVGMKYTEGFTRLWPSVWTVAGMVAWGAQRSTSGPSPASWTRYSNRRPPPRRTSSTRTTVAPWGTGPHPYLVAGAGLVDEWTLELPADEVLTVTDDRLIPVALQTIEEAGPERFDFRSPRRIDAVEIDHAYTALTRDDAGLTTVRGTTDTGTGVGMTWVAACPWVQIHTADKPDPAVSRLGLAVEPMTCAPDAFNDDGYDFDTGLIHLAPGGSSEASWRIFAIA